MRALIVILSVCLCPAFAQVGLRNPAFIGSLKTAAAVGGSCATLVDSVDGANNGVMNVGDHASRQWSAVKFVASESATICTISIPLQKVGSPTFTVTAHIFDNDDVNDYPNASLGSSDAVSSSTFTTNEVTNAFINVSAAITSGATNWVVLEASALGDASNYVEWNRITRALTDGHQSDDDSVGPWSVVSSTRAGRFWVYKQ